MAVEYPSGFSEEPMVVTSDGEMRSSSNAGCVGVSLLAICQFGVGSAFANAPCETEMPTVEAGRWPKEPLLQPGGGVYEFHCR